MDGPVPEKRVESGGGHGQASDMGAEHRGRVQIRSQEKACSWIGHSPVCFYSCLARSSGRGLGASPGNPGLHSFLSHDGASRTSPGRLHGTQAPSLYPQCKLCCWTTTMDWNRRTELLVAASALVPRKSSKATSSLSPILLLFALGALLDRS